MTTPYEIVAGAVDAYLAVVGTAFTAVDAATPAGDWVKLGTAGSKDISEDGVLIRSEQTVQRIRTLGTTGPRKAYRDTEDLVIELTLMDSTIETYQAALNQLAITTVAGPPAEKTIQLLQGTAVALRALMIRGVLSPYADTANYLQWDIPIVYQEGNPETIYRKGEPVGLKLTFIGLVHDTLGFGKLRIPTA